VKATGSTSQRGYGWQHQKARKAALAAFWPGQPCARCQKPMLSSVDVELDHDDRDRTKYIGLSHKTCNREHGGYKSAGPAPRYETPTTATGHHDPVSGRWCVTSRNW
jgi:hypothetical protein